MYIRLELEHDLNNIADQQLLKQHNIMVSKKSVNSVNKKFMFVLNGAYNNLIKYLAELSDLDTNAEEISAIMEDGW